MMLMFLGIYIYMTRLVVGERVLGGDFVGRCWVKKCWWGCVGRC